MRRRSDDTGPTGSPPQRRPAARATSKEGGAAHSGPSVPLARGRQGEDLAALYLEGRGYRVVGRNRRAGHLEVDLVAELGSELVIVEVRLRSREEHGTPEETVDFRKRARLRTAGRRIWEEHGREELTLRFDLVSIHLDRQGLRLRHHISFLDPDGQGTEGIQRRF